MAGRGAARRSVAKGIALCPFYGATSSALTDPSALSGAAAAACLYAVMEDTICLYAQCDNALGQPEPLATKESLTAEDALPTASGGPKKRKRRAMDELMGLILAAAADEFKTRGFARATTASIAKKANVTEAQLFRYFKLKSDLFSSAVFDPLEGVASVRRNELPEGAGRGGKSIARSRFRLMSKSYNISCTAISSISVR